MGQIGGFTPFAVASFTRPNDTTAYASGDLMANSTTAASVLPLRFMVGQKRGGVSGVILGARIAKSNQGVTNASFRLNLFSKAPFVAGSYPADNAALVIPYADLCFKIGYFDFTSWNAESAAAWSNALPNTRNSLSFNTAGAMATNADNQITYPTGNVFESQCIFGLLEARAAFTPTALEQFTINLDVQSDS